MTSWNPLNVFSQKRDDLSSAFDPSRTGDPLPPSHAGPAIGFGDTRIGQAAGYGDPRRRPIGFAPPEDDVSEPRYRTELSFKRHHELPRASATIGGRDDDASEYGVADDGEPDVWQTPEPAFVGLDDEVDGSDDYLPEAPLEELSDTPVEELPVQEKVPFYKREISFRRKRTAPDEAPETVVVDEDEATELAAQADDDHAYEIQDDAPATTELDDVEPDELAEAEEAAETDEVGVAAEVVAVEEPSSEDRAPDEVDEADELSADAAPAGEADASPAEATETVVEPVAELTEDDDADFDAVDDSELAAENIVELPVAAIADSTTDAVADEDEDLFAAFDEPVAVAAEADELSLPVDAAEEAEPESGSTPDSFDESSWPDDDAFDVEDDQAEPKGRFGSRSGNRKNKEKAPKRKPAKSGKGRRVVGLKIGASQIAAAVVAETDGGHELVELARRPLAAGIVVDGEVRDQDALANALKAFFDEEKLPKKDVRIGLASNRIGVRTFDIVGIDDEARFDNAVRFKAHEVLPVAVHESVLDYRVLEERPNEAGEPSRRVLLVVAPRDQVEPYAEVARRAGIKLAGVDLEALGLLRAFVDPKPFAVRAVDDTATVVVAIGHESSTLLVAGGGACEFTRVFDWGGGALQESIAAALDVHPAEAATILRHLSLSGPGRQFDGLDEVSRAKALDAVRLRLTPFARELVSSLQFYQTQDESLGIGGIVITGGTSHLEGLGDALHQMIGVSVSVGDPLARVITSGDFDPAIEATMGSMAVPIGLAIDDIAMRGVNLLPKDTKSTKSSRATLIAVGAPIAAVVPLVAVGFLYLGAHGKAADKQAELAAVQAEISALPKPTGPTIDASVAGDEAVRATAIASVLGGRVAWDAVFGDMARILPSNVWLKSLSVKEPESSVLADGTTTAATPAGQGPAAPTGVNIEGYTYTQTDVARLLARLATLPSLERVTLASSAREVVGKKDVVHFIIVADLSSTGGAS